MPNSPIATGVGSIAILLWSILALFTTQANQVPPLLLLTLTFAIASALFFLVYIIKGEIKQAWQKTPINAMLICGSAFFAYHFFYFYAFSHAPAVEAGLIAYLWPLLIVLMAGLGPNNRLLWPHVVGALVAFAGTGIMLFAKDSVSLTESNLDYDWTGYGAAIACAFIWSSYSVFNRRYQSVPSSGVLWYCLITAFLAGLSHLALEEQNYQFSTSTWLAIFALGLGPVGVAFFCWDFGVKRGNLSLLGVLSYTTPALSTAWLVLFTNAPLTKAQFIACAFITLGALFASVMPTKKSP
ncbi:aromatic amino acid exporter YddG [Marinomonas sp.]